MQKSKNKQDTLAAINALVEIAYDQGFADGHGVGNQVGFVAGVMSLKAALACGLRHGSRSASQALRTWRTFWRYKKCGGKLVQFYCILVPEIDVNDLVGLIQVTIGLV